MRSMLLVLLACFSTDALAQAVVNAQAQTEPLTTGPTSGRAAGLWLAPDGGALVLVTNQLAAVGLSTYQLTGALREGGSTGPTVSVDVRYGVTALGTTFDLVMLGQAAGGLAPFQLTPQGTLNSIAPAITTPGPAPRAMALWRPPTGTLHVLVGGGNQTLDDFALQESTNGLSLSLERTLVLSAEPQFVKVDDARSLALISTGGGTLLQLDLAEETPSEVEVLLPDAGSAPVLGGVASFSTTDGGFLAVVSQPGANRYWVYDVLGDSFLGDFQVRGVGGTGLVSGGQGVAASTSPFPNFPRGVLVLQDPANLTGPNAKLVSLDELGLALGFQAAPGVSLRGDGGRLERSDAGSVDAGSIGGCPVEADAGRADGGQVDGGGVDAGPCVVRPDGGGTTGRPPPNGVVVPPEPSKGCACSETGLLFPAAVGALIWARRRRFR